MYIFISLRISHMKQTKNPSHTVLIPPPTPPPPPPPSFVNWLEIQIRCLGDRPLELAKCGERNRCPRGATLLRHKNSGICHPSRPAPRGYKALIHTHVAFTANSPDLAFVESGRVGWVRYGGEGGLKRRNGAAAPPPVSRNP